MGRAFKEQVIWLTRAWDGWSEAEQVVALYSVARKLSPVPTRFLQILLTYNFPLDGSDILLTEARANDPTWVSHICESGDGASDLLHHLPLLRPTNGEAKAQYLALIPKVLSEAVSCHGGRSSSSSADPCSSLEKARQLLSYSLIHPALSPDERRSLATWLKALEDKLSHGGYEQGVCDSSSPSPSPFCPPPPPPPPSPPNREEERRSSLNESSSFLFVDDYSGGAKTALANAQQQQQQQQQQQWNDAAAIILQSKDECRWSQLEVPPSPNNSGASSRSSESESVSEEQGVGVAHPGMRDMGVWLKSLRLHKYSPLLSSLPYASLLALDEESLAAKGVTKGARHKIILSIAKLNDRSKTLENIEKDLMSGGSALSALTQLKQIALTPMLPSKADLPSSSSSSTSSSSTSSSKHQDDDDADDSLLIAAPSTQTTTTTEPDLPSQFTRVMGKVCTQLLVCVRPDDEAMSAFLSLADRCAHHEAFTAAQAKRLSSWKQQILRIWHPLPPSARGKEGGGGRHVRRWSHQYSSGDLLSRPGMSSRFAHHRYSSASPSQVAGLLSAAAAMGVGGPCLQAHLTSPPPSSFYNLQAPGIGPLLTPRNSLPGIGSVGTASLLSPQHFLAKRPSLQETPSQLRPHVTLQRTRSAPSRPHQPPLLSQSRSPSSSAPPPPHLLTPEQQRLPLHRDAAETYSKWTVKEGLHNPLPPSSEPPPGGGGGGSFEVAESDLTNRLESLCLSMTEHALG